MTYRLQDTTNPVHAGLAMMSCLSLSGGGVRGLFTARILTAFEEAANAPAAERFDLIGGTSIGGIIAIGLAAGIPAAAIHAAIADNAPSIFKKRFHRFGLFTALYPKPPLRKAIRAILGDHADRRLSELPVPVLVTAVDHTNGSSHLFRSLGLAEKDADDVTLMDAALATSAAPTLFPPHRIGDRVYVDGGLAANAPDLIAVSEAMARLGAIPEKVHVLSIGTAGKAVEGKPVWFGGRIPWIMRHRIVELTLAAQEHASTLQASRILGTRYLRVDKAPQRPIRLDEVERLADLDKLAAEALETVTKDKRWHETANRRARRLVEAEAASA
ncbi:patatin [Skermanella aerolata]|uniref:Patatin n=1 Tax=Skermanella aerolata TaxID=393310 RepID=A0A512DSG5_9PROT|nr:CBASS cGAMP-activated phospholipase [Skermanella aerolata]GEO39414.1 patatin [Skermanella aerolata]